MVLNTSPKITAAFYDNTNDRLFLGTEEEGVYLLGTKPALKLVAKITAENTKLQSNTVNTIFKDKSGRYWIGTDQGLLVVCDPRLRQMGYGRRLCAALPPMAVLEEEAQAIEWLSLLASMHEAPATRSATTGDRPPWPWRP